MFKVNSLDFLNRETFGVDILNESGNVLCSAESQVTPQQLLILYYKDLYVKEELKEEFLLQESEVTSSTELQSSDVADEVVAVAKIGFDEAMAQRVVEHCKVMADMLNFDDEKKSLLEKAAYYHNIGSINLTVDELEKPNFRKIRATAGYNYMTEELGLPEKIAKVSKTYLSNYDPNKLELLKKNKNNIPVKQIVAIASYYEEFLAETSSKEEALVKMLRLGGNKFNIYLLHRFVHNMRKVNA